MSGSRWAVLGLTITSSWGNGHATTYRGLLRALAARGHAVTFFERDVPWYAAHRDDVQLPGVDIELYADLADLQRRFAATIGQADVVVLGSYVPEALAVAAWLRERASGVRAFYDIDTPITLAALESGGASEYMSRETLPDWDVYLSFAGGRALDRLSALGARHPRPLYCSVDLDVHAAVDAETRWDLGYLGTYAADRQPGLETLLLDVARREPQRRFVVAGPQYPADITWPAAVERIDHVAPPDHARFYASQRFTLNLTRADMRALGHAPSVRLFEAAACGTPVISDVWDGLDEIFEPESEILLATSAADVSRYLGDVSDDQRAAIAARARARVLAAHTAEHRAAELESFVAPFLRRVDAVAGPQRS